MPSLLFLFVFNVCLLFNLTFSINDNSILQLSIYPTSGYSTENIEIRCQILEPSIYDNVYLSVRTDNVKPSGILLMVDNTINHCRNNKERYFHIHICNSSMISIQINHEVINDSLHTIEYACSQGEVHVFSSYQILKHRTEHYYDQRSANSSSTLTHTLFLLLFVLTTIGNIR